MASPIEPFPVGPLHDVLTIKPPPTPPPSRPPPPIRPAIFRTQHELEAHYSDNPEAHHLVFTDLVALKRASAILISHARWEKALKRTPPTLRMIHATRLPKSVPPDHFDLHRRLAAAISKTSGAPDLCADGSLAYAVPYAPRKLGRSNVDFLPPTMPVHHALMAPPVPSWLRYQKMLILRTPWTPVAEEKRALLDEVAHAWKTDVALYVRISDSQFEGTVFMPRPKDGQVFPPELMASLVELRRTADQKGHDGYMAAYQAAERRRAHAIRVWCAASPGVVLSVEPDRFVRRWPPLLQDVLREYQTTALKQGSAVYASALAECSRKMARLVQFYADCALLHGAPPRPIDWRLSSWWKIPRYGINDASGNSVAWPLQLVDKLNASLARFGVGSHVTWFSRALLLALWKESLMATGLFPDVQVLECTRFPMFIAQGLAQVWRERFKTGLDVVEDRFIALLAKFRAWAADPVNQQTALQLGGEREYAFGATTGGIAASRQEIAEWLAADDGMKNVQSAYDGLYEAMGWEKVAQDGEASEAPSAPSDVSDDEAVDSPVSSAAGSPVVAAGTAVAGAAGSVSVAAKQNARDDSGNDGDDEASNEEATEDNDSEDDDNDDDDDDDDDDYYFDPNAEPTLDELRFKAALELSVSTAARRKWWPVQRRRCLVAGVVASRSEAGGSGVGRVVKRRGSKRG